MYLQAFALQEVTTKERMKQQTLRMKSSSQAGSISAHRLAELTLNPSRTGDAVIISSNELQTMRNAAATATSSPSASRHSTQQLPLLSSARKTKIQQIDSLKSKQPVLTEDDLLKQQRDRAIVEDAAARLEEQHDDVKEMNRLVLYAKTVTVRDRQLEEKKFIQSHQSEEEKRMDLDMEAERIKLIKHYDIRDAHQKAENERAALVLQQQIKERAEQRLRQQDLLVEEKRQLVAHMKELERKEMEAQLKRLEEAQKVKADLVEANAAAARAKMAGKQAEIQEDKKIAEYLRKKAVLDAQREAELEQAKYEKELQIARLRAIQERDQDHQAAADALRAKRAREAKDREWRLQQLEKARKDAETLQNLVEGRERSKREKAHRFAEQALAEQDEYFQVLEWQKEQIARDQLKEKLAREADIAHKQALRDQMAEHNAERKAAAEAYLAEGREVERQRQEQKNRLLQIKQNKLEEMIALGIPPKFQTELANKRVMVDTIHFPNEKELAIAAAASKAHAALKS